jgi:hypothetical protein
MPKFVIERQYLVPMYQHIVVEAENLEEACKTAITDDTRVAQCGTGSTGGGMSGPRRSANGVIARLRCRGIRLLEGELRSVRRRIPTRPARPAARALASGML